MEIPSRKANAVLSWLKSTGLCKEPLNSLKDTADGKAFYCVVNYLNTRSSTLEITTDLDVPKRFQMIKTYIDGFYKVDSDTHVNYQACEIEIEVELFKLGVLLLGAFVQELAPDHPFLVCLTHLDPLIQEDIKECVEVVLTSKSSPLSANFFKPLLPSKTKVGRTPKRHDCLSKASVSEKRGGPSFQTPLRRAPMAAAPEYSPLKQFLDSPAVRNQVALKRKEKELSQIKQYLDSANDEITKLLLEKESLTEKINGQERKEKELRKIIEQKREYEEVLALEANTTKAELEKMSECLKMQIKKSKDLEQEVEFLTKKNEEYSDQVDYLERRLDKEETGHKDLFDHQTQLLECREALDQTLQENENLKEALAKAQEALQVMLSLRSLGRCLNCSDDLSPVRTPPRSIGAEIAEVQIQIVSEKLVDSLKEQEEASEKIRSKLQSFRGCLTDAKELPSHLETLCKLLTEKENLENTFLISVSAANSKLSNEETSREIRSFDWGPLFLNLEVMTRGLIEEIEQLQKLKNCVLESLSISKISSASSALQSFSSESPSIPELQKSLTSLARNYSDCKRMMLAICHDHKDFCIESRTKMEYLSSMLKWLEEDTLHIDSSNMHSIWELKTFVDLCVSECGSCRENICDLEKHCSELVESHVADLKALSQQVCSLEQQLYTIQIPSTSDLIPEDICDIGHLMDIVQDSILELRKEMQYKFVSVLAEQNMITDDILTLLVKHSETVEETLVEETMDHVKETSVHLLDNHMNELNELRLVIETFQEHTRESIGSLCLSQSLTQDFQKTCFQPEHLELEISNYRNQMRKSIEDIATGQKLISEQMRTFIENHSSYLEKVVSEEVVKHVSEISDSLLSSQINEFIELKGEVEKFQNQVKENCVCLHVEPSLIQDHLKNIFNLEDIVHQVESYRSQVEKTVEDITVGHSLVFEEIMTSLEKHFICTEKTVFQEVMNHVRNVSDHFLSSHTSELVELKVEMEKFQNKVRENLESLHLEPTLIQDHLKSSLNLYDIELQISNYRNQVDRTVEDITLGHRLVFEEIMTLLEKHLICTEKAASQEMMNHMREISDHFISIHTTELAELKGEIEKFQNNVTEIFEGLNLEPALIDGHLKSSSDSEDIDLQMSIYRNQVEKALEDVSRGQKLVFEVMTTFINESQSSYQEKTVLEELIDHMKVIFDNLLSSHAGELTELKGEIGKFQDQVQENLESLHLDPSLTRDLLKSGAEAEEIEIEMSGYRNRVEKAFENVARGQKLVFDEMKTFIIENQSSSPEKRVLEELINHMMGTFATFLSNHESELTELKGETEKFQDKVREKLESLRLDPSLTQDLKTDFEAEETEVQMSGLRNQIEKSLHNIAIRQKLICEEITVFLENQSSNPEKLALKEMMNHMKEIFDNFLTSHINEVTELKGEVEKFQDQVRKNLQSLHLDPSLTQDLLKNGCDSEEIGMIMSVYRNQVEKSLQDIAIQKTLVFEEITTFIENQSSQLEKAAFVEMIKYVSDNLSRNHIIELMELKSEMEEFCGRVRKNLESLLLGPSHVHSLLENTFSPVDIEHQMSSYRSQVEKSINNISKGQNVVLEELMLHQAAGQLERTVFEEVMKHMGDTSQVLLAHHESDLKMLSDEIHALKEQVQTRCTLLEASGSMINDNLKAIVHTLHSPLKDLEAMFMTYTIQVQLSFGSLAREQSEVINAVGVLQERLKQAEKDLSQKVLALLESSSQQAVTTQVESGAQLQRMKKKYDDLCKKFKSLEKQAEIQRREGEKEAQEASKILRSFRKNVEKLENEKEETMTKLKRYKNEYHRLKEAHEQDQRRYAHIEHQFHTTQLALEEKTRELQKWKETAEKWKAAVEQLKTKLKFNADSIMDLQRKNQDMKFEVDHLKTMLTKEIEEKTSLERKLEKQFQVELFGGSITNSSLASLRNKRLSFSNPNLPSSSMVSLPARRMSVMSDDKVHITLGIQTERHTDDIDDMAIISDSMLSQQRFPSETTFRSSLDFIPNRTVPVGTGTCLEIAEEQGEIMAHTPISDSRGNANRVEELRRRNTLLPQHLKSAYAVELDTEIEATEEEFLRGRPSLLEMNSNEVLARDSSVRPKRSHAAIEERHSLAPGLLQSSKAAPRFMDIEEHDLTMLPHQQTIQHRQSSVTSQGTLRDLRGTPQRIMRALRSNFSRGSHRIREQPGKK